MMKIHSIYFIKIFNIKNKDLLKKSKIILKKKEVLSFSYKENLKQKILEQNFNTFKQNIYKLFDILNDDSIIFHISKELNIKIDEFYDKDTFNTFYEEIMKIENKELLKNSFFN